MVRARFVRSPSYVPRRTSRSPDNTEFTLCTDPAERTAFLQRVLTAGKRKAGQPDSRLRVVLALRAGFFGRCTEHWDPATALNNAPSWWAR
ncbi:nSTAND1 domain-containing NTPase [Streptomyces niger]|uniref:nSTAND1 domain-containing NTPase n=1 Tax=Streptomyces niger TaxID=66373 RepID=UPI00069C967C|nr:hypothetical protein [Streptomyces niger]